MEKKIPMKRSSHATKIKPKSFVLLKKAKSFERNLICNSLLIYSRIDL